MDTGVFVMKIFKKLFRNKELIEVDAVTTWSVRWRSPDDYDSGSLWGASERCQFFTSEENAREFYDALRDAVSLLQMKRCSLSRTYSLIKTPKNESIS